MNPIQCWALSPAAVRLLAGRAALDPGWFQWECILDGERLRRITLMDLADEEESLLAWIMGVSRQSITPVLVLHDNDPAPWLDEEFAAAELLATLRVGDIVPASKTQVLQALSMPDPDYLDAWARFVLGPGRDQGLPVCAWPELAVAYAEAASRWRDTEAAAAVYEQLGLVPRKWTGPPLHFQDFHPVPRPAAAGRMAFDLAMHPGAGAVKKDQGWRSTGLMPPVESWDPHGMLQDEFNFVLELRREAPMGERVAGIQKMSAAAHGLETVAWTLRTMSAEPWELQVKSPRTGQPNPPAVLTYRGRESPPESDSLELSFVCIDTAEDWTQPRRRVTLQLAVTPQTREAVACTRRGPRWDFILPATRLVEPDEMRPSTVVCLGIEVRQA